VVRCHIQRLVYKAKVPNTSSAVFGATEEDAAIRTNGDGCDRFGVSLQCGVVIFVSHIPKFDHGIVAAAGQSSGVVGVNSEAID